MSRISVITVVRNNLVGLRTTVESLGAQEGADFEHIVIDGASTDGTVAYLESMRPTHPFTYVSEPDSGLYDAMDKGIARSTADIVMFLNGGDVLTANDVLRRVQSSYESENWVWAYGGIRYVDEKGTILGQFFGQPFSRRRVELARTYVPHPATFVERRRLAELGGFDSSFGLTADQELILRLAEVAEPAELPIIVTDFLVGGAHAASSPSATSKRYHLVRRRHNRLVGGSPLLDWVFTTSQSLTWTGREFVRERLLGRRRY